MKHLKLWHLGPVYFSPEDFLYYFDEIQYFSLSPFTEWEALLQSPMERELGFRGSPFQL